MSEPTEPWKWGDEGKPQPHNPTNNYPAGTRFLCCGYDGHMAHFSQGNWVRHEDYEMVLSSLQMANEEIKNLEEQIKTIKLACREEMEDLKKYYEDER